MFIYEGDEPVVEWALEMHESGINRNDITMKDAELKIIPYINRYAHIFINSKIFAEFLYRVPCT